MTSTTSIDLDQVWSIDAPHALVVLTLRVLLTQLFIAAGWLVAGYVYTAFMAAQLPAFSALLNPQATAGNLYRCMTAFSFIFLGLTVKTILTVGLSGMTESVLGNSWANVMQQVAGSKGLKPFVFQGIMAAVFQIIGWSIVGIAVNDDFG